MKPFKISVGDNKITHIFDNRYSEKIDITGGKCNFGSVTFTKRDEDVNLMEKRRFMPHAQHICELDVVSSFENNIVLKNNEYNVNCEVNSLDNALKIDWHYENSVFSKFAAYLPLNFMSHKNGKWENQFLISSPYYQRDTKRVMCMFTRPDGNHLMLIVTTESAAFRIDYSHIVHFFDGFEIIANLDRSYGSAPVDSADITAYLVPVSSYEEGLKAANNILGVPCAKYDVSSCFIGKNVNIDIIGECDEVKVYSPKGDETVLKGAKNITLKTEEYGFYRVVPFYKGKQGVECTCFAHFSWQKMFENSILSLPVDRENVIGKTLNGTEVWMPPAATYDGYIDTNLCEHTMWAWAQLRYMQHYPVNDDCRDNINNLLNIITADNESIYRERQTIIPTEQTVPRKMSAYNTYKSDRIQEAFNGANVMLNFWRVYKKPEMLELAVNIIDSLVKVNMKDGCIIRNDLIEHKEDYTTVTAMIIPVVDLYVALSEMGDERAEMFKNYAEQIADFVVHRDMDFPTESTKSDLYNTEYEDGSISCSALTALYVARYVKYKPEYVEYAERVMKYHDAFCVYTCNAPMFHSSLRWWENLWEGDTDGPAICCGHAWTIWRGEAEFWLGLANKDAVRMLSSYNAFISNFAKQDKEGNMYAIYQCEPCISGNCKATNEISRRFAIGFPKKKDTTLSRYAYARAYDTWFACSAVIDSVMLNAEMKDGKLYTNAPFFKMLYISGIKDDIIVCAENEIEVFCDREFCCKKGEIVRKTDFGFIVKPDEDSTFIISVK